MTAGSPVPQAVSTELERVVERWRQLPLDRALSYAGRVRALVQSLADAVAAANGVPAAAVLHTAVLHTAVPDLGPATLMDQLTVMIYDASATAATSTAGSSTMLTARLAEDLASLRRDLS